MSTSSMKQKEKFTIKINLNSYIIYLVKQVYGKYINLKKCSYIITYNKMWNLTMSISDYRYKHIILYSISKVQSRNWTDNL